jgi:hypothetical protein
VALDETTRRYQRNYKTPFFDKNKEDRHLVKLLDQNQKLPPIYLDISVRQGLQKGQLVDEGFVTEIKSFTLRPVDAEEQYIPLPISVKDASQIRQDLQAAISRVISQTTETFSTQTRKYAAPLVAGGLYQKDRDLYLGALNTCEILLSSDNDKVLRQSISNERDEFKQSFR